MVHAVVMQLVDVQPHPNADRLELLTLAAPDVDNVTLVSGKHYRLGDAGVWFRPGTSLPGWLARQLWLPVVDDRFKVREIEFRGVPSPGVWAGEWYRNDSSVPSRLNSKARAQGADREEDGWLHWGPFKGWPPGTDVARVFDVVPL